MKKTAAVAALVLAFAVSGCSDATAQDDATAEQCAQIEASYMGGDSATARAVNESLDRSHERICD